MTTQKVTSFPTGAQLLLKSTPGIYSPNTQILPDQSHFSLNTYFDPLNFSQTTH